jgi:hypothetical protein
VYLCSVEVILALLQPRAPPRGPPPSPGTRRRRRRRRHQYHSDRLPYFHQNAKACCYSELAMVNRSTRANHPRVWTLRLQILSVELRSCGTPAFPRFGARGHLQRPHEREQGDVRIRANRAQSNNHVETGNHVANARARTTSWIANDFRYLT